MASNLPLKYFYNDYLLNDTPIPAFFFSIERATKTTKFLLKYAVEEYLRWTPFEMRDLLNKEVLERMKLYDYCRMYLDFPIEYDIDKDFFYYAAIVYPKTIRFDEDKLVVKHYENILSGKQPKFKKNFLKEMEGAHRVRVCFRYLIENLGFSSTKEIYSIFSTPQGTKILEQYKLNIARRYHYEHIIDFAHDSLSNNDKNIDYYNYYKICSDSKFKNLDKFKSLEEFRKI